MGKGTSTLGAAALLGLAMPAARAAAAPASGAGESVGSPGAEGAPEDGVDLRVGTYAYILTAEDGDEAADLPAGTPGPVATSAQVGATLHVRSWGDGWRSEGLLDQRSAVSGPDPRGRPGETGTRVQRLHGDVRIRFLDLDLDVTAGRFRGPAALGLLVVDGLSVAKALGPGLTSTVFGGRRPLTADVGHLAEDQGQAYGADVRWRAPDGALDAQVSGVAGTQPAILGASRAASEPQATKAFAARSSWQPLRSVSLAAGVQAGDRMRLSVRSAARDGLAATTEDVAVVDMDLFSAYLGAHLRLSRDLRLALSGQRLQATVFTDGAGAGDAFHDGALRATWRFWSPATLTARVRRRLRPAGADPDDRLSLHLALDDLVADGLILNGGAVHDAGGAFDKTRTSAEAGWRTDLGGVRFIEVAGTFSWIRRDNGDGGDAGYSAADLADGDDPLSAYALALAPNDTAGLRLSYLDGALYVVGDGGRDLSSGQGWAFLHAGWRWR